MLNICVSARRFNWYCWRRYLAIVHTHTLFYLTSSRTRHHFRPTGFHWWQSAPRSLYLSLYIRISVWVLVQPLSLSRQPASIAHRTEIYQPKPSLLILWLQANENKSIATAIKCIPTTKWIQPVWHLAREFAQYEFRFMIRKTLKTVCYHYF